MIRTHGVGVPSKLRTFLFDRRRTDRLPIDHLRIDLLRVDCLGKDGLRNRGKLNKKATRQRGRPPFTRENSSNGGEKSRQYFLGKEYESKNQSVKQFLGNKCLCFQ